jgi:hypothetical protein
MNEAKLKSPSCGTFAVGVLKTYPSTMNHNLYLANHEEPCPLVTFHFASLSVSPSPLRYETTQPRTGQAKSQRLALCGLSFRRLVRHRRIAVRAAALGTADLAHNRPERRQQ